MSRRSKCAKDGSIGDESITLINPIDLPHPDRRTFLTAVGGTGVILLAGCISDDDAVPDYTTYLISFTDQGIDVEVRDDQFIWDQASEAGVEIPYRCGVGRCGDCTIKYDGDANEVVDHSADQRYLEPEQIDAGWILTCVAYARDDFAARVAHPDD